jgi:hypothetical protein
MPIEVFAGTLFCHNSFLITAAKPSYLLIVFARFFGDLDLKVNLKMTIKPMVTTVNTLARKRNSGQLGPSAGRNIV